MKHKDKESFFALGVSFVGVSVVFMTAVNKVTGTVFLAVGCLYMIIGMKAIKDKEKKKSKGKK